MNPAREILLAVALLAGSTSVAAACADHGRARSGAEILDDSSITTKVKSALQAQADVDARDIAVRTCRGEVQLTGFVESRRQVERAAEVTAGVEGVRQVTNDLTHKLEMARRRSACKPAGL